MKNFPWKRYLVTVAIIAIVIVAVFKFGLFKTALTVPKTTATS